MHYNIVNLLCNARYYKRQVKTIINSQMLKGTLEGCILKVISENKTYGYEISQQLKQFGFSEVSEGTIYPLLLRLEKSGLIEAEYKESKVGPKRKYFSITAEGMNEMNRFVSEWKELEKAVNKLFDH